MGDKGIVNLVDVIYREQQQVNCVKDNGWCPPLKRKVIPTGFGWGVIPSELVAIITNKGKTVEIPLHKYFRENIGRLTKKRQKAIKDMAPPTVMIDRDAEYVISNQSLFNWSEKVLNILKLKRKQ